MSQIAIHACRTVKPYRKPVAGNIGHIAGAYCLATRVLNRKARMRRAMGVCFGLWADLQCSPGIAILFGTHSPTEDPTRADYEEAEG
jgi:hypothetical protein